MWKLTDADLLVHVYIYISSVRLKVDVQSTCTCKSMRGDKQLEHFYKCQISNTICGYTIIHLQD